MPAFVAGMPVSCAASRRRPGSVLADHTLSRRGFRNHRRGVSRVEWFFDPEEPLNCRAFA